MIAKCRSAVWVDFEGRGDVVGRRLRECRLEVGVGCVKSLSETRSWHSYTPLILLDPQLQRQPWLEYTNLEVYRCEF